LNKERKLGRESEQYIKQIEMSGNGQ